ncbi:MAG: PqqD family protein [Oscillospiraceae bacterium]
MKIKQGYMLRTVAGNAVVVPTGKAALDFSGVISLNETGAFLWKLLEQDADTDALVKGLLNEFDTDEATARRDVSGFYEKLEKAGLLA